MAEPQDYTGQKPAWCPGCGNFQILKVFRDTMAGTGLEPHELVLVSGIGQAGKFPHYTRANVFNGLHGRTIPVATAVKLVNHDLNVVAVAGDGDCYGEGGNHLIHAMRRNIGIKVFVHNNQIYGLTKGQASPTTGEGVVTKTQPFGVLLEALNPMALAVALDAGFVARSFSGDREHLGQMMQAALAHDGFALLDIFQPCVVFNKVNTAAWYKEHTYHLPEGHDPADREAAFRLAMSDGEKIPLGVIYKNSRAPLEKLQPVIAGREPLVRQEFDFDAAVAEVDRFY
ncbi:MAG: 2-oxoacid:ferredoxin oxidoreductase subunit beta [Gaiellales bacterium]|nr:MAG: 2-oxoacid:ferredoxin oxidoreductase subunit beta [Gaiellales bacterium]